MEATEKLAPAHGDWREAADVPESRKDWEYMRDFAPMFWDGTRVPSFSQISLWHYGPYPEGPWMKAAQDRGKLVHQVAELDDLGELDDLSIQGTALEGYLESYRAWRTCGRQWAAIEQAMHAEVEGVLYIVRPDRLESRPQGLQLWDLKSKGKTSKPVSEDEAERHGVELAAQAFAVEQAYGIRPLRSCLYIWPRIEGDKKLGNGRVEALDYSDEWYMAKWQEIVAAWRDAVGYDVSWRTG